MGLRVFLRDLFSNNFKEVSAENVQKELSGYIDDKKFEALVAEEFMINVAINMIANAITKCKFRTYLNGVENKGNEYYLWNYRPNNNQNSSEFMHELIYRLLYENRTLVTDVAGQLFIADNFCEGDEVFKERTFTHISRQSFSIYDKRMSEVMYFKLNNVSVKRLLDNLCIGYNELLDTALDKFYKSGGEKGILSIDAQRVSGELKQLNKTYDEVMEDIMNNRFKKFFGSRNAVLPLFNGYSYESKDGQESTKKSTSELKDVTDIDDKIVVKVANAFNIPVALLKGEIADVEMVTRNFLTFCIDPICDMLETEINSKRSGKNVLNGTYVKIDTTSILHIDLFSAAESADKLIASGMYSIDELRIKCNDAPLNTDYSREHFITKNYQNIKEEERNSEES